VDVEGEERVIAGRYRLIARVGGGGMGELWRAYDERLHRTVAVKRLHVPADLTDEQIEDVRRRTVREGRVAARLRHRNSITIFDVIDDGSPYLVMEYVDSTNLADRIAERGSLKAVEVAGMGAKIAAALAAAHEVGVVHRDVKPGNVLLGAEDTVKITDFGVSRVVEDVTGTTTSGVAGTPAYLSPEVARGDSATYASDVYSLGATLYTAVEGRAPYEDADNVMKVLFQVGSGNVAPPATAGPLTDVIVRMMALDPQRRPDMVEVRDTLEVLADDEPVAVGPTAPTVRIVPAAAAPLPTGRNRGPLVVCGAVLVVVAAVVAGLMLLDRDGDPGTAAPASPTNAAPTTAAATSAATTTAGTTTKRRTTSPAPPPPAQAQPPAVTTPYPSLSTTRQAAAPPTPQDALTDYYALMPGDLTAGWNRLTARYQRSPAGGEDGYRAFWSGVDNVAISGVSDSGTVVEATVDYDFADGRQVRERHRYNLVRDDGIWKLDRSTVLSSARR
jgi:hypothetical protein